MFGVGVFSSKQQPMDDTYTPQDEFERLADRLLKLFELLPDEFFKDEGISPSLRIINQVKQYARLPLERV